VWFHPRGGPRPAAGSVPSSNVLELARGRSWVLDHLLELDTV
jgi:hypothetical protein